MSRVIALVLAIVLAGAPCRAGAQDLLGPPAPGDAAADAGIARTAELLGLASPGATGLNPLDVLETAGSTISRDSGKGGLSTALTIMIVLTVISLAPSLLLMTTCFVRILIVLGLLRQAMGTQTLPPAQMVTGLALFMTLLVMGPTLERVWNEAVVPYQQGEVRDHEDLWKRASQPMRDFMFDQIEATGNWSSLYMVLNYRGRLDASRPESLVRADVSMTELVPAFMLSELKTAFLMGFKVYLPFLVIDMVIASILISMSMMMLPPVLISLPFKLLLFVMVDGWSLVVGSLMTSFVQDGAGPRLTESSISLLPQAQPVLAALGLA